MSQTNWTVAQLYQELLELDEHQRIEAKRASHIGDSVMQTVCAFANEPGLGGGWLLLGVREPDEEHATYWLEGVSEPDRLLNDLQGNCRSQFSTSLQISSQTALLEGKRVVAVFVPELDPAAKPCAFVGKPDRKNKRKTGAWRRGINGDYECEQEELAPLLLAKSGTQFDQVILPDAQWDDLDPMAISLYRTLRARVRAHAEELLAEDPEMLRALNLVKREADQYRPTVAGLLLLGKPLSLRRLLPAVRVDYARVQGTAWVSDPEQRFETTQDFRDALIRLIPKLEAAILDDMPRYFRLKPGELQRSDQSLLPQKVVREAVVNAVMHRDYQVHQPTLVVRFSNRLEIRNAGFSLKPEAELGEMGSVQRNPTLAAVLYDLDFAETKGSGIRTMRRLLADVGLSAPLFASARAQNQFSATYLLHQLLGEEQLAWLAQFKALQLKDDEAKALILAREVGAVDNAALRAITELDTLAASQLLRRLCAHPHELLEKKGESRATCYCLVPRLLQSVVAGNTGDLDVNTGDPGVNTGDLDVNTGDLDVNTGDLGSNMDERSGIFASLPKPVRDEIASLGKKPRKEVVRPLLLAVCRHRSYSAQELATLFDRQLNALKSAYLNPLREEGLLAYRHPEVVNHPEQGYQTSPSGMSWLQEQAPQLLE